MRILVTISPRLYREVLALSIHRRRPDFEVLFASPSSLDREAEIFGPHVLVHDAGDEELLPGSAEGVLCHVRILAADSVDARIELEGAASEFHDVSLNRLFTVLEEAERLSLEDVRRVEGQTTVPLRTHRGRR